jgi:RNA polymerase sigma-70 factor (ECF subfamily)
MQARGEKRKLRAYARTGIDPFEDFAAAATERASASGDRRVLLDALAGLKRADREVVLLHAWGDLTTNEIASALGVPHATVRTKLARSRKRLASELSNLEPADSAPPTEILKETI